MLSTDTELELWIAAAIAAVERGFAEQDETDAGIEAGVRAYEEWEELCAIECELVMARERWEESNG